MQCSFWRGLTICLISFYLSACSSDNLPGKTQDELNSLVVLEPCSQQWFVYVEDYISTSDGAGHGPDLGSLEWKSVIEFKLGLRDNEQVPDLESRAWCEYIDDKITSEHN
ncbi:hypothetical protein [Thalassomonas sp. M1454]|uniref:hypothetical protein n=1 Tax=Thalassomonas sp. M1454 TaxID=2594477 RepID=UPI00118017C4|nr:hypothetical protein [Thalassomonas sp. M1454]TRX53829.1 hypothetical protein FNN08_12785 [Thalassomonas sp. M1454]